jgi:hypothetical protein
VSGKATGLLRSFACKLPRGIPIWTDAGSTGLLTNRAFSLNNVCRTTPEERSFLTQQKGGKTCRINNPAAWMF